jgi:multisubunit Na+/H+ antiporter MnhG subunit
MKKKISDFIYFIIAALLMGTGIIVRFFLVDIDLGARFKNFNHRLLSSDILFIFSTFIIIVGLILFAIRKNKKTSLSDLTVIISALLISPISFVLILTPFLETYFPGKVDDNIFASILGFIAAIGTFACFIWIVLFLGIIIKQSFNILMKRKI